MSAPVYVVRTGTANLASVLAGLGRCGATVELTSDPERVRTADRVVLPGVGAFGAAMAELVRDGLDEALRARISGGRPTLAICLGEQLFASASEEAPGIPGLGVIDGRVTRFVDPGGPGGLRVPQMGWNDVTPTPGARFVTAGFAYFANSYKLDRIPDGWEGSVAHHGGPFVASIERGPIVACQFHPELSGAWGHALLRRWLEA